MRTESPSDGRIDIMERIVAFCNSTNGPKVSTFMTLQGKFAVCSEIDSKQQFVLWADGRIYECGILY